LTTPGLRSNIIIAVSFTLTTDANVANRDVHLQWHHGATQRDIGLMGVVQPSSFTFHYLFAPGLSPYIAANTSYRSGLLAYPIDFQAADTLEIVVDTIQATDQLSLITHWWNVFY
jgi:hypothetical protein